MCLVRSRQLLQRFSVAAADFIFFTNEKVFTIALPANLQNDCVYALTGTKKCEIAAERLLHTRPTFSISVIVCVAVSKLGSCSSSQASKWTWGSWFHRTKYVATKQSGFEPDWLQDLGSDAGASVSNADTRQPNWSSVWSTPGQVCSRALLTKGLTNSEVGSEPVFELTADTLNASCSVQHGQHSVVVTYWSCVTPFNKITYLLSVFYFDNLHFNIIRVSHGTVMTLVRWSGQFYTNLFQIYSGTISLKLMEMLNIWQS